MLKRLLIENIAIIDRLDIEFDKGLTILTGELVQVNLLSLILYLCFLEQNSKKKL